MKKITIFLVLTGLALVSLFTYVNLTPKVSAEDVTSSTTTISDTTSSSNTYENSGKVYYYSDYEDLVNQIYNDIYADIHDSVYQDIVDSLTSDYYDQIYDNIHDKLMNDLSSGDISVYLDSFQNKIHNVVNIADSSVVGIVAYQDQVAQDLGSGVIYKYDSVSSQYYVITNNHVVEPGNEYSVVFADGSARQATLVGVDTEVDIAILKFSATANDNIIVSQLGDSDNLSQGDFVLAVGNPQGFDFYGSVTMGIVSGLNREVEKDGFVRYIQHDAAINEGNSGGPIYDLDGNVVGINVSKLVDTNIEGMGFSIPINTVKRIIARIEDGTLANYNTIVPRLGANFYDVAGTVENGKVSLDSLKIGYLTMNDVTVTLPTGINTGLIVTDIDPSLTLGVANLHEGDLIYSVNGHVIKDADDYFNYVYSNFESGDSVTIQYYEFNTLTYGYFDTLKTVNTIFR